MPARRYGSASQRSSTTSVSRRSPRPRAASAAATTPEGARLADATLRRLRYPNGLRHGVVEIVRFHTLEIGAGDALAARRLLARHGDGLALDLIDHREADLRGKTRTGPAEPEALAELLAFRGVVERERGSPHRLGDLAVDGSDLIALGYRAGPLLGRALQELLAAVVDEPSANSRTILLARAEELLQP